MAENVSEQVARSAGAESPQPDLGSGRRIPPPLNPDTSSMIFLLEQSYGEIREAVLEFRGKIATLARGGKLDIGEFTGLLSHYRQMSDALIKALLVTRSWNGDDSCGSAHNDRVHVIADHAKHVYAVGTRDIAALQYRCGDLAYVGKLDRPACEDLQRRHCVPLWERLYQDTLCVIREEEDWDGGWDWCGNTYSDGRQVMTLARTKDWETLECVWPSNEFILGDGAVNEHPRGSVCQIAPVVDPHRGDYLCYEPIEIDLDELIAQRNHVMSPPENVERHQ